MIRIYGLHTPLFFKVVHAAEAMGHTYEISPVSLVAGENNSPEHLKRHPFGKVPVIEHEGKFLFESNAIVRYLGALRPNSLFPADTMERAQVDQWIDWFAHQGGRWASNVWFQKCIAGPVFKAPVDEKMVAEFTELLLAAMPVLEKRLETNQFFCGEQLTLADVCAHAGMKGFKAVGLPLGDFKNFIRWFEAVESTPACKRTRAIVDKYEGR